MCTGADGKKQYPPVHLRVESRKIAPTATNKCAIQTRSQQPRRSERWYGQNPPSEITYKIPRNPDSTYTRTRTLGDYYTNPVAGANAPNPAPQSYVHIIPSPQRKAIVKGSTNSERHLRILGKIVDRVRTGGNIVLVSLSTSKTQKPTPWEAMIPNKLSIPNPKKQFKAIPGSPTVQAEKQKAKKKSGKC
ncbi:hypothetical protein C7212DRAFT_348195 [Tuber magnatum]|uniref:Uncharacterized protein n=1 Tax=Tuber magnatum TaxID=42249 RepID=A0A317SDR8_9PEZI|nr:hypothetical protein C7212DRAFT_348195 [Tuber magnatum]